MRLSILIPTLPESAHYLKRLNAVLDPQIVRYKGLIEKIVDNRGREIPTGTKRNDMIKSSVGDYICQIDCDDMISANYVDLLMEGISKNVDVVTFQGVMTTDGRNHIDFIIRLGEKYEERGGKYYRYPNHLSCMKRSKIGHVKFLPIWQGEDFKYATRIRNAGLLKTEHHIAKRIYFYQFVTDKNNKKKWAISKVR